MLWFLFGIIFIFLGLDIQVANEQFFITIIPDYTARSINLLPAFVGYLFFILGCAVKGREHRRFRRLLVTSAILGVLTLAHFILEGFTDILLPWPTLIRSLVHVVLPIVALYSVYELTECMKIIERSYGRPIGVAKLSTAWTLLCLGCILLSFALFLREHISIVVFPCLALYLLSVFWYCASFHEIYRTLKEKK